MQPPVPNWSLSSTVSWETEKCLAQNSGCQGSRMCCVSALTTGWWFLPPELWLALRTALPFTNLPHLCLSQTLCGSSSGLTCRSGGGYIRNPTFFPLSGEMRTCTSLSPRATFRSPQLHKDVSQQASNPTLLILTAWQCHPCESGISFELS